MKKLIIVIVILMLTIIAFPQENWGWPESLTEIGACTFYLTNPSFYFGDSLIFDTRLQRQLDNYQLHKASYHHFVDSLQVEGDWLNLPDYDYLSPFLSYSKQRLYFSANLPEGYGGFDIYVSEWLGDSWGEPVNLGENVNSEYNDLGASLPVDESEIFFFQNDFTEIDWDNYYEGRIFKSEKLNNQWTTAEELPDPINPPGRDCSVEPCISADGNKLYFCGRHSDSLSNIFAYVSYRRGVNYWQIPILLNSNINYDNPYWPWVDFNGNVYSAACDSAGFALTFIRYYTCPDGYLNGNLLISFQQTTISENPNLADDISMSVYPNPFNTSAVIEYNLPTAQHVSLDIYDMLGRKVTTLIDEYQQAGGHWISWNASDCASGLYFYKITTAENSRTERMVLLK